MRRIVFNIVPFSLGWTKVFSLLLLLSLITSSFSMSSLTSSHHDVDASSSSSSSFLDERNERNERDEGRDEIGDGGHVWQRHNEVISLKDLKYISLYENRGFQDLWSCWTNLRLYENHIVFVGNVDGTSLHNLPHSSVVVNVYTNTARIFYDAARDIIYVIDFSRNQLLEYRDSIKTTDLVRDYDQGSNEDSSLLMDAIIQDNILYTIERYAVDSVGLFVTDLNDSRRRKIRLYDLFFGTDMAKLQYFRDIEGNEYLFMVTGIGFSAKKVVAATVNTRAPRDSLGKTILMTFDLKNSRAKTLPHLPIDITNAAHRNDDDNGYLPYHLQKCRLDNVISTARNYFTKLYASVTCRKNASITKLVVEIKVAELMKRYNRKDFSTKHSSTPITSIVDVLFIGSENDFVENLCLRTRPNIEGSTTMVLCFRENRLYFVDDDVAEIEHAFGLRLNEDEDGKIVHATNVIERSHQQLSQECRFANGTLYNRTLQLELDASKSYFKMNVKTYKVMRIFLLFAYPAIIILLVIFALYVMIRAIRDIRGTDETIRRLRGELFYLNSLFLDSKNLGHNNLEYAAPSLYNRNIVSSTSSSSSLMMGPRRLPVIEKSHRAKKDSEILDVKKMKNDAV